jgi:hypothetical protein
MRARSKRLSSLACSLLLGAAILAAPAPAPAAVPVTLTHQGRLFDDLGLPITDSLELTFSLYSAPGDTVPIWS